MGKIKFLVVVGSSGCGKTTLVNGLRTPEFESLVVIPHRLITRPKRKGDDLTENSHIGKKDFEDLVKEGEILPYWVRNFENGRVEQYGFRKPKQGDARLCVYSANNAFLRDNNPTVKKVLQEALVVIVTSSLDKRQNRLGVRSPDMKDAEREFRLNDDGSDLIDLANKVEIIDTTYLDPKEGQLALQNLINSII